MGKEVWELRKEEEGSTANERVRGRDCTPLPPGAVTTCGQWSHFHPHATPPGQATTHLS